MVTSTGSSFRAWFDRLSIRLATPVNSFPVIQSLHPSLSRSCAAPGVGWRFSVLLGVLTVGSNVGLMGTSAFLISSAALHPELGTLQVAIVGVRFFGIARGVFRYAERLSSHNVTFRLLARLRTWFYRALEPLAPARLMQYRSGDLLGRIVYGCGRRWKIFTCEWSPRPWWRSWWQPGWSFFFGRYAAGLAWTYLAFMLLLGLGVPLLASALSRRPGAELDLPPCRPAGPSRGRDPGPGRPAGLWTGTGLFAESSAGRGSSTAKRNGAWLP